jgi:Protein of unknown function (DUF3500)
MTRNPGILHSTDCPACVTSPDLRGTFRRTHTRAEARLTRKSLIAAAIFVIGAGGYVAYRQISGSADLSRYANVNTDLGATVPPDVTATCGADPSHARIVCLGDQLKATLPSELLAEFQRPYTVADAQKWSNFPPFGYADRVGPALGDFTPEQRGLIKAILLDAASLTSDEGYDELEQILNADDYLAENTTDGAGFSSSNYHVAFLGTPAATGTWQLYFGGHHFAMTNTYTDGVMTGATPSFRGVEPFVPFTQNGRENAPMLQEQAAFAAALAALTPDELTRATLAGTYTNIIAGPQQDDAIPATSEGLRLGDTSAEVQALTLAAMETYVRDVNATDADAIMAGYAAGIADTFLGFSGTPTVNAENDYVRIDGPSVWIEFSLQPGRSVEGIHPHSVWRDKTADYGGN